MAASIACNGDGGGDGKTTPDDSGTTPDCVAVAEIPYDGVDQDCSGDDLVDVDEDGFDAEQAGGPDCDDDDGAISPDAAEIPYDGIDQDCAGGDLVDADDDGHDALQVGGDDCDDDDPDAYPGAVDEVGDGVDQDCSGADGVDLDGDGFPSSQSGGTDCDDDDPDRNPDAEEIWYDGTDQDCDRSCDYDADGDGYVIEGAYFPNGSPCDAAPGPEVYAPTDCNDEDIAAYDQWILSVLPDFGAVGVPQDTEIRVELTSPDPTAALALVDPAGQAVAGVSAVAGTVVTFVPDAPLDWDTTYEIRFTGGCGQEIVGFTVEGEPIPVDPAALAGAAWELDLALGTWTEPGYGLGELFSVLVEASVLLEVTGGAGDQISFLAGTGLAGAQDPCIATTAFDATFDPNPTFVADGIAVNSAFYGYAIPLPEVDLTARIGGGGVSLSRGALSGLMDTRNLGEALALGATPDAFCQLVAAFGIACEVCPTTSEATCMRFAVEDLAGAAFTAGPLAPRTQDEIDADPTCP